MFPFGFNNIYGYLKISNMYMSSAAIEEKLKRQDCTVDELLDEDELIQEVKNQNTKLLNFFDKNNVKKLIDYIITEPVEDDQRTGHRFPFIASEVLNCDVARINDYFISTDTELIFKERKKSMLSNADSDMVLSDDHFTINQDDKKKEEEEGDEEESGSPTDSPIKEEEKEKEEGAAETVNKSINDLIVNEANTTVDNLKTTKIELLDHLLSFVETDKELNYVLAGYFAKFLIHLLNKYPQKIITYIYQEKPEILGRFVQHCDRRSISELIPKFLLVETYCSDIKNILPVDQVRMEVIHKLFTKLELSGDTERINNLVLTCIEVCEHRNTLEIVMNNKSILEFMFIPLCQDSNTLGWNENFNYNEILILFINLIKFALAENIKTPGHKSSEEDIVNSENSMSTFENTPLGELLLEHFESIAKNFSMDTVKEPIQIEGTFGMNFRPLGVKRVRLAELVFYVFNYFKNVPSVFDAVLNYFFEFEWNNLYQHNFDALMRYYINNNTKHPEITRQLFDELKILNLFSSKTDNFIFNSDRKINRGFFAILIDLCYRIHHVNCPTFKAYYTPEWENFIADRVNYWVKLFERKLCAPGNSQEISIVEDSDTGYKLHTEDKQENTTQENDNNPFKSRDELFFGGSSDDDWFNSKKEPTDNVMEDINGFEFVEDTKVDSEAQFDPEKNIKVCHHSIKVDELEEDNYNDANYWKGLSSVDKLESVLKDLEL